MLSALVVMGFVLNGTVRYTSGDSRLTLLTSKAILMTGSPNLNAVLGGRDVHEILREKTWLVTSPTESGAIYYTYPVGTPFFSIPFVAVGQWFGLDPINEDDDALLQIALSALLLGCISLMLTRLAAFFLPRWTAALFSLAVTLGSTLTSALGTAFWSHGFQTLFLLAILIELVRVQRGQRSAPRGGLIGLLLFSAYLCRPTTMVFILPLALYLFTQHRRTFWPAVASSAVLGLLFVGWSYLEFGTALPGYYRLSRWPSSGGIVDNLPAILFGPARGLWVFSPALALGLLGFVLPGARSNRLFLMCWLWIALHSFLIARSPMPWGGWCFGPRFFTECVPGLALGILLTLVAIPFRSLARSVYAASFLMLSLYGIWIHTGQGLFNKDTFQWNGVHAIDSSWKQMRWNWTYRQGSASQAQFQMKQRERDEFERVGDLLARVPAGGVLLCGPSDSEFRAITRYWNQHDRFGRGRRVFNNLLDVRLNGARSVYVVPGFLSELLSRGGKEFQQVTSFGSLGEFLEEWGPHTILISVRDEGRRKLDPGSMAWLENAGSGIREFQYRDSYLAVIRNGRIEHEQMGPGLLRYTGSTAPGIEISSGGYEGGDTSSILVGGKEFSANTRGFNAVVLGAEGDVLASAHFDTHVLDVDSRALFKVRL